MELFRIFQDVLSNQAVISAVTSSIFIILLGFFLTKRGTFKPSLGKDLSTVVLTVGLPALSFNAFMSDINPETFRQGMMILIWGFVFQGALIFLMKAYYFRYTKDERQALTVLTTLGSTTFFAVPIIGAIYGAKGVLFASIFNISYRIYLYSWGYISFSGLKMSKDNLKTMLLNPIIIATFLGLIVWIFQGFLPQVTLRDGSQVAFARIDKTAVWLYRPMTFLASICSPLAWLSIGATLAQISLNEASRDRTSWVYTITKIVVVPMFGIIALFVINLFTPISFMTMAVSTLMMTTPPATVAVAYAIKFDRQSLLASNASLIATVFAVIWVPLTIFLLEVINQMGIFVQ
ncbi:AEC family transporter [Entomospira nematocerorum]|uniref:AEC family transporter n=1 Tax=Entomospira nematocerorum TaxID=2719987 RepID=A0A968GBF6_9SPIO|nr:AEC family transporter [Entomospira nematocera]NIZ46328.1 AEC family transporter [Entomospira nematocera]WDI33868.1 AEC family transporter [Entomospira nematocera]